MKVSVIKGKQTTVGALAPGDLFISPWFKGIFMKTNRRNDTMLAVMIGVATDPEHPGEKVKAGELYGFLEEDPVYNVTQRG